MEKSQKNKIFWTDSNEQVALKPKKKLMGNLASLLDVGLQCQWK